MKIPKPFLITLLIILFHSNGITQSLLNSYKQRNTLADQSLLKNYPVRNIGPVVQGGRITDIEVNLRNKNEFFVGYASGGLFYTKNNGITFDPIFDNQGALGIGDIALAPSNPNIIYVGTGENNSSRSSYAGTGVYKSTDKGKTWESVGLENTQHIGKVIIHPQNPDVVWVASMGALYSKNQDRGVYKTTDGGKTWAKTLFVNDSTGIIDLVINPSNPQQLWASSWERERKAWNFKESGLGSAIYMSNDLGETWTKSTNGFSEGKTVGRIGIQISQSDPNILYALLDSQKETREPNEEKEDGKLKIKDFIDMTVQQLQNLDNKNLNEFLKDSGFPNKYTAEIIKKDVAEKKYTTKDFAEYFGDANDALFNTKITGAELYRSSDSGKSWAKVNSYDLEGVYFTYGYYFGEVRIDPKDPDKVYIFGVPLLKTTDGGVTFHRLDTLGDVHVDHQALWIDPDDPKHILLGNDGGLYQSYDEGANWLHINNVSVGQFYTVNVDMEKPYNVYGGTQDNGTLKGSSESIPNRTKKWERIFGGDGMFVAADPRNSEVVYTGFQFGNYFRLNLADNKRQRIRPQHDIGTPRLRFNWRTPVVLSIHNADIVYFGSQILYRSMNKGDTWEAISPDLTTDKPQGDVPFSTITTIAESPLKFGLIYIGTDDGNIQLTKSSGGSWENLNQGLPVGKWVSSIHSSKHHEGTVFITLNGYREDDFGTYLFKSTDYGKNWKSIKGNLPESVANVVIQDSVSPDLLFCGLDNGTYASLDGGKTWEIFSQVPNVASYDMVLHPRDNELVLATHGRSIYVADVKPLQQIAKAPKSLAVFKVENIKYQDNWGEKRYPYLKPNTPHTLISYYVPTGGNIEIQVHNEKGTKIKNATVTAQPGFNTFKWNLKRDQYDKKGRKESGDPEYIQKGKYTISFSNGTEKVETELEVK